GTGKFQIDIRARSDRANPEFPIATAVSANQRNMREPPREVDDIHRTGFAVHVSTPGKSRRAANLEPGMYIYNRSQLSGQLYDWMVVGMITRNSRLVVADIFYADARSMANPLLHLLAALLGIGGLDEHHAGNAILILLQQFEDFRLEARIDHRV